jgi:signal transduction histidine kinase
MSKRDAPALMARGATAIPRWLALSCAAGIAALAIAVALIPSFVPTRAEQDAAVIGWIDPLVQNSGTAIRNAIEGDRALRSYVLMKNPKAEDDRTYDKAQGDVREGIRQIRTFAGSADDVTKREVEGFVRSLENWLEFAGKLDRKAHDEGREAAAAVLLVGVGADSLDVVREAYDSLERQLRAVRDEHVARGKEMDGVQQLGSLLPRVVLALAACALAIWLAFRASAVVRPPEPALDLGGLRNALDRMADGVAIATHDGIVLSNAAAGRVIEAPGGLPRAVALYRGEDEPISEDEDPLALALAGERVAGRQLFVARPGGGLARVTVSAMPVTDDHGETIAAVAVFADQGEAEHLTAEVRAALTRARAAEEALELANQRADDLGRELADANATLQQVESSSLVQERKLSRLVSSMSVVGVALFDAKEFRLLDVNEHGLQMLGERRRIRDARGSTLSEIVPNAEECGLADIFRRVTSSGELFASDEYRCEGLRHGISVWRFSLTPIAAREGDAAAELLFAGVDVTAAVEARERLVHEIERKQRMMQAAIDRLPEGVVVADADGQVRAANRAALAYGTPASGLAAGSDVADFASAWRCTPTAGGPQVLVDAFPLTKALRGEVVSDAELTIHATSGEPGRPVRISAFPVLAEGQKTVGAVMVARDAKRVETVSANGTSPSEEGYRFEDTLLAISNDLRTPIVSIQGMVDIFRQKYAEAVPDVTALHYLELTQRNADQIANLINEFAELSELGRSSVSLSDVPLAAVVEEAWHASSRGGVDLRVTGPLPVIKADRGKLVRALRDLFDMCVRWRSDGGISWVHVRTKDLGSEWEIEISDNGRGFGAEEGEALFGPLARPSDERNYMQSSQVGFVGVGLAAVRRVAEMHGGAAAAAGVPGKGATYSLMLAK